MSDFIFICLTRYLSVSERFLVFIYILTVIDIKILFELNTVLFIK